MGSSSIPPALRLLAEPLRWRVVGLLATSDRRVGELVAALEAPQSLVSYHLGRLRSGGLVVARRSSFDARETYYHLDLARCADALAQAGAAIHPALAAPEAATDAVGTRHPERPRVRVLFLCTGNSARSPMAAALLRHHGRPWVHAASAGSHPRPLHPAAARVLLQHHGIDLATHRPTHVDSLATRRFDYVISLCDKVRETDPPLAGHPVRVHWSVADPTDPAPGGSAADGSFLRVAEDLDIRVRHLLPVLATRPPEEKENAP
jgi:protein-tyrosine-phosphatase/DNA-binding transcriptional ArsR family regulator